MTRFTRWALLMAVALLLSRPVSAQNNVSPAVKEEASAHFRQGVELFREGAYRAALVELQRAYEIMPDHRVLFNIGQTQLQIGEYVEAIKAFEGYLVQGGAQVDAARRQEVENELTQLRKRVATLAITVSVEGAEVYVDGTKVGVSPLAATVPVSVGRHRVLAQTADGRTASQVVDLAGGDLKEVTLALAEPKRDDKPVVVQQVAPAEKPMPMRKKVGFGLLGVGAAAGIVSGIVYLTMTKPAADDLDDARDALPGDASAIASASDDLSSASLTNDILTGAAVALAATGVVLLLVGGDEDAEKSPAKAELKVGFSPSGVFAGGRF